MQGLETLFLGGQTSVSTALNIWCNTYNPADKLIITEVEPPIPINLPEYICNLANEHKIFRMLILSDIWAIKVIRAKPHEITTNFQITGNISTYLIILWFWIFKIVHKYKAIAVFINDVKIFYYLCHPILSEDTDSSYWLELVDF